MQDSAYLKWSVVISKSQFLNQLEFMIEFEGIL